MGIDGAGGALSRAHPVLPARTLGITLVAALPLLVLLSVRVGVTGVLDLSQTLQGVGAALGLGAPLEERLQIIVELRLWHALTAAGVGAALSLSGVLIQGLFRNGLAAPSVIGVTGGATLGATAAILLMSGYGPAFLTSLGDAHEPALATLRHAGLLTFLVPAFGFIGAVAVVFLVAGLSSRAGRFSVPTLLLTGIAVNTCIAGVLSLVSSLLLDDWDVSRAIFVWTFGTLADRSIYHVLTVWSGLALAVAVVPFVAWELDLLAGGEEDASSLGVDVKRVRLLSIGAAALAAASAVAVAGQIAFLGLVVPHLLRMLCGARHRALLPLAIPGGAVFLVGIELLNHALLARHALRPGVVMSLIGGVFFLCLLAFNRREVDQW